MFALPVASVLLAPLAASALRLPYSNTTIDLPGTNNTLLARADFTPPFADPTPGVKKDADITYYLPGVAPLDGPVACGWQQTVDDPIVAISKGYWDKVAAVSGTAGNGNKNPLCNMVIEITTPTGKERAVVTDRCGDCPRDDSVDVTPALAKKLIGADYEKVGRVTTGISWKFVERKASDATFGGAAAAAPAAAKAPKRRYAGRKARNVSLD